MYKLMNAKEVVEEMFKRQDKFVDFTFDQEIDSNEVWEPTGWYGIKLTTIFDEYDGVLAIGYYGGGCTECYDIYECVDDIGNLDVVKQFCADKMQQFMDHNCECDSGCSMVCVEVNA